MHLSTCAHKFTVLIRVIFESRKKTKNFLFKRDILKKNKTKKTKKNYQFNKDKRLFSKWILCFFIDILSTLHSFRYTSRIEPSDYHLFFLYHIIIPINNPSRRYGFKSYKLQDILTSVEHFPC